MGLRYEFGYPTDNVSRIWVDMSKYTFKRVRIQVYFIGWVSDTLSSLLM